MPARITLVTQVDNMPLVQAWVNSIKKVSLYVGITEETDPRDMPSRIGNIALAAIMENGAPSMNVPPRPFMKPGMDLVKGDARVMMKEAAEALYRKDKSSARNMLEELGRNSVASMRGVIESSPPPPLDPGSVKRRKRKGVMDTSTLDESGQLKESITFEVRGL
jgi:hypothetical protein